MGVTLKFKWILAVLLLAVSVSSAHAQIIETVEWESFPGAPWNPLGGIHDCATPGHAQPCIDSAMSASPSGGKALRFDYNIGTYPTSDSFGRATRSVPENPTTLWAGHWAMYSANFPWNPIGTKLNQFTYTAGGWNANLQFVWFGPNNGVGQPPVGLTGTQQIIWGPGTRNNFCNLTNVAPPPMNTWFWIEMGSTLNSPGVSNGTLDVYLNDVQCSHYTDISIRDGSQTSGWGLFDHTAEWGGGGGTISNVGYWWVDHTVLSTTRQGIPGGSPPPPPQDTTDPTQVTGVVVTAASSSSILITHDGAFDASGIASYIYRRCPGDLCANFQTIAQTNSLSHTDTNLNPTSTYRYQVTAQDNVGRTGPASAAVQATTLADVPTPVAFASATLSPDNESASTVTFNVTTPAGNNRLMVACVMARDNVASDLSATSVTYNNLPLTKIRADGATWGAPSHARVEQWRLIAPPVGTYSFNAQWGATTPAEYGVVGVTNYTGVDQLVPVEANAGASGNGVTASVSITTLTNNAAIVDCGDTRDNGTPTIGAGQTQRIKNKYGVVELTEDWMVASTVINKTPAGAETMDWTQAGAGDWILNAIALKPASATVAPTIASATVSATGVEATYGATAPSSIRVQVTGAEPTDTVVSPAAFTAVATQTITDDFNRANAGTLGGSYATISGMTGSLAVNANKAQTGALAAYYGNRHTTAVGADQYIGIDLVDVPASGDWGLIDLWVHQSAGAFSGYFCEAGTYTYLGTVYSYWKIGRMDAGVATTLVGATIGTAAVQSGTYACRMVNNVIALYRNGVLYGSAVDPLASYASGSVGASIYLAAGAVTDVTLDNLVGGTLASPYTYSQVWVSGSTSVCLTPRDSGGTEHPTGAQCPSLVSVVNQDVTPPVISGGAPTTTLAAGTTSTIESVITNEPARCRRKLSDDTYDNMTDDMTSGNGLAHTFNATGLANNTTYTPRVRCTDHYDIAQALPDNKNTSSYSYSYSVALAGGDTTRPSAVTGFAVAASSPTSASVTFVAATDNVAVTGYDAHRCNDALCTTSTIIAVWNIDTTQSLNGLLPGETYYLAAKAFDAAGNRSLTFSNVVQVTMLPSADIVRPGSIANVRVVAQTFNSLTIGYDAATDNVGVARYEWELCVTNSCASVSPAGSSLGLEFTLTGLDANATYILRGKAVDFAGNISLSYSNVIEVSTSDLPEGTAQGVCPCKTRP